MQVEDVIGDLEDHDGVIRTTTRPRGRPKRHHSEGVGNHSSKKPRTASVEVSLPSDSTTSYNLPSASSSIMSEVVNVILAQVASQQQRQQQSQQILTDELQDNVEVVAAPPPSNELIIIENSLDSTNTVEVWAGGEGGGANITGEVNQILERIGVGQSEETIQDPVDDVMVTRATAAEEVITHEVITEETSCEEPTSSLVNDNVEQDGEVTANNTNGDNVVTDNQVSVTNESVKVDESSATVTDSVIGTPSGNDDVILPHNDNTTTASNDNAVHHDDV